MSVIDNRVVEMGFDNTKFGAGVQGTLSQLEKLKAGLHLEGASKGLENISAAAGRFDSSPMEQGASRIGGAFTAMQATVFGAFANIGAKVSSTAMSMASSLTLDPMKAGFDEYELKMGSIQTILANTSKYGTKLPEVNAALEDLNKYADKTIYNFGDMTKNIGLFTNAGMKVDDATAVIKGFSNEAAASGTSAEGAAGAAYQLSQALSAGKVTLMDWRSLQNVGMGNANMKSGIIDIAKAMGTMKKAGVSASTVQKDFNGSLEKGWLTADVMTNYMKIQAGEMDAAAMSALGLSDAQIKSMQATQKTSEEAATKVRTFTQLMDTTKEAIGSGWSESFGLMFGDFDEATNLFTSLSGAIGGFVGRASDSRNKLLREFKDMGGRTALIDGLTEAFWALGTPLAVIGQAFRQVFPKTTAKSLYDTVTAFRDFMVELRPAPETLDRLRRTFAGVFAILHIGWTVIKAVAGFLVDLFAGVEEGDKGILKFTATIGDFFVGLDKAISAGQGLNKFFDTLLRLVFKVINPIKDFGQVIGNVFAGIDLGGAGSGLGEFITGLLSFGSAADSAGESAKKGKGFIQGFLDFFKGIASWVADFVGPLSDNIANAFSGIDYNQLMQALQTGLLGGLVVVIKQLGGVFGKLQLFSGGDKGPGFLDKIKDGLDGLTGTMKAMQANLKASMLIKIAAAIGILALAVVLLAGVDAPGLVRATAALTVMFVQLGAAMAVFQKIGSTTSILKLNLMGAALILISIAILALAGAVKILSSMSWEELARGLGALVVLMGVIIGLSRGLDKSRGPILRSAFALIIMGAALKILIGVVRDLGSMDLTTMGKGLLGVGALLTGLAIFTRIAKSGANAVSQAAAILLLSMALKVLAGVVKLFAAMSWTAMAKGFAGISGGLIAMGIALKFMPSGPKLLMTAFGIAKVAAAFGLIAKAFAAFEDISWDQIARGLTAIGGSLGIMTLALKTMPKPDMKQTITLLALAYAIKQVVGSLTILGDMDAAALGKSMAVFSGVLATIVLALRLMKGNAEQAASIAVVAGSFQMLQEVLTTWGAMDLVSLAKGMGALIGVLGIMVVALNLLKTEAAGAAALGLVAGALSLLVPALVTLGAMPMVAIGAALVGLAGMFGILVLGLKLLQPVIPVLLGLSVAIALLGAAVFLAGAGLLLFSAGITALAIAGGAGVAALVAIVSALVGLIPMIATQIGLGIVALLTAIGNSGKALGDAFVKIVGTLLDAIIRLAPKLGQTLLVLLQTGLRVITTAIPMFVRAGLSILVGVLRGIADNIGRIVSVGADIGINFINALAKKLPAIIDAGIKFIISFVNGLADGIRNNSRAMGEAGGNLASAMVDGMINGLSGLAGKLIDAAKNLAKDAWNAAKDWLGIHSPSRKFAELGKYSGEGFVVGLKGTRADVKQAVTDMFEKLNSAITDHREKISSENAKLKQLYKDRYENMRDIAAAQKRLQDAQNRQVGSTAKKASTRNAEIKRETAAKNKAIASAKENLHNQVVQQKAYDDKIKSTRATLSLYTGELNKMIAARTALGTKLKDERTHLDALGKKYDDVTKRLEAANEKLKEATKVRDDYKNSIKDQYNDLPEITKETSLKDFVANLEKKIVDTQQFTAKIGKLRAMGLNDDLYKELLAKGPDAMPFIDEVIKGGKTKVQQLNTLDSTLNRDAGKLATTASGSLYQAGVDAAKGLVDGLKKQQTAIDKQMEHIAGYMVAVIKKKLGIKSPSRVFAELGSYTSEGLAKGLDQSADLVGKSAESVGQSAIDGMKKTISGLGSLIEADVDVNPTIAPVLDLSGVRKEAAGIGDILGAKPLDLGVSYSGANTASAGYSRNQAALAETAAPVESEGVTFIQNNVSPKALSSAELYRQTNNQLSRAKGALPT